MSKLFYALGAGLLKLFGNLPRDLARPAAAALAQITVAFLSRDRRVAIRNLEIAFPLWTDSKRRQTLRRVVRQLGWMGVEFARFPRCARHSLESFVTVDGSDYLSEACRRGRGVFLLSGHFCPWELSRFAIGKYGYRGVNPVRAIDIPEINTLINQYRSLSGNCPVFREKSARVLIRALRANGIAGIAIDEDTPSHENPVFVDFFGMPAATSTAAARLVRITNASAMPCFIHWDTGIGKYRISFLPIIETVRTDDPHGDLFENTSRFTQALESFVRLHPDHWLWLQPRWRTRPLSEESPYRDGSLKTLKSGLPLHHSVQG